MRIATIMTTLMVFVLLLAGPARADLDKAGERVLKNVQAHLTKGQEQLDKEAKQKRNSLKLRTLDRALYFYGRAEKLADKRSEAEFEAPKTSARAKRVEALNRQSRIYFERKSLEKAEDKAKAVLEIDKNNALAKATLALIQKERDEDIFDDLGNTAIDRVKARRRAAGIPIRDRGRARRR